jgi:hypothetical protein
MSPSPPSGNNDEDDNNCKEFSDESADETISSLFVQEYWLDNHEDSDYDTQRTRHMEELLSHGYLPYQVTIKSP